MFLLIKQLSFPPCFPPARFGIYELLPAFLVSLAVCVVVSLVTPAPTEDILAEFDAAK